MPKQSLKKGRRVTSKHVLAHMRQQVVDAQEALQQAEATQQQQGVIQQVLVDAILQLEEVSRFKARVQANGLQAAAAEPLAAARGGGSSRYVTSLLEQATPEQLAHVLTWQAADWIAFVGDSVRQFSVLLDLVGREDDGAAGQPREAYVSIAEQQLDQAVDTFSRMACTGHAYADVIATQAGKVAATNHITMQLEAPTQQHWRQVAERLQLTDLQLLQLAAGYQTFVQLRKVHQEAQLSIASLVSCTNSLSVQVLAAAKEERDHTASHGQAGSTAWDLDESASTRSHSHSSRSASAAPSNSSFGTAAAAAAAAAAAGGGGGAGLAPGGESAAAAAVAADSARAAGAAAADCMAAAAGEPEEDPLALANRLMRMINRSTTPLQYLLFNTLTRRQIAWMVVASYPFIPRAAPIIEAAIRDLTPASWLQQQQQQQQQEEEEMEEAAAATEDPGRFAAQRASVLRQQCNRWWQEEVGLRADAAGDTFGAGL